MGKILLQFKLLIVFIVLIFISCTPEQKAEFEKRLEEKHKKCPYKVDEFEYNGHEYIYFSNVFSSTPVGTFVHNPDCKKCKDIRSKEISEEENKKEDSDIFNYYGGW